MSRSVSAEKGDALVRTHFANRRDAVNDPVGTMSIRFRSYC